MTPDGRVVLEVFGEGKTDIGEGSDPDQPTSGVLPILVHALCGRPPGMLVKRKPYAQLQRGGLQRNIVLDLGGTIMAEPVSGLRNQKSL